MIENWEQAEEWVQKISGAIKKVCEEYGLEILDECSNYENNNNSYDFEIIISINIVANKALFKQIIIEYYFRKKFYFGVYLSPPFPLSPSLHPTMDWNYIRMDEDKWDPYELVKKFFKDNDVLTKDEMTIKDIIE